ncbi:major capsid protein [Azotobacter chroococcum]|uniref:Major capsid protein E n=1 Tax=Azotobacter chroococcum TaxID=353 RepID=A0A4R1PSU2_9GAMM|nr:major capsid protein [Azotobacter chroococcum]TBV98562.1 major capsid protein [Azotobacter chroococcum]TCL34812.1 major capsid protein E [Azotobacter chroococcum]
MAEISVFEDEAFGVQNLIAGLNDDPHVPGQISNHGLFVEEGSTTVTQQIEKNGSTLELVPAAPRGAPALVVNGSKRQLVPFNCVHLPQQFTILADEIQGIRAFGSRTELQAVQDVVNARFTPVINQLAATHEYQRVGALKGQIVDADGVTVLHNLFTAFGLVQQSQAIGFNPDAALSTVDADIVEALDKQEDALGNATSTGAVAWCGKTFWAELIADGRAREAYLNHEAAAALRGDRRQAFEYGGVLWVRYRGKIGGSAFIADNEAYLVPEGVPDLFRTIFAPANYMETVNTLGVPYYGKLERMAFDKGVMGEAQSNPLHICTKPTASIKLTS